MKLGIMNIFQRISLFEVKMSTKIKSIKKFSTSSKDQERLRIYKKPRLKNIGDIRSLTLGSSVPGSPDSPVTPGKEFIFS